LEKFKTALIEGTNWLIIIFLASMYVIMGLMKFEDGNITLKNFGGFTWLDWALWGIMTFIPALISLVISSAFKKEGLKQGKVIINTYVEKYQQLVHKDKKVKVRGEKEFLREGVLKDGAGKFLITLTLSFVAGELFLSIDVDSVLKIAINLAIWAVMGFMTFGKYYNYAIGELKEWYIIKTAELRGGETDVDKPVFKLQ
jgi:hypothetical protein